MKSLYSLPSLPGLFGAAVVARSSALSACSDSGKRLIVLTSLTVQFGSPAMISFEAVHLPSQIALLQSESVFAAVGRFLLIITVSPKLQSAEQDGLDNLLS